MEHDNTVPEAVSRRRAIAGMLGIPAALLGLISVEELTSLQAAIANSTTRNTPPSTTIIIQKYQQSLRLYWELYFTSSAYDLLDEITSSIRYLRTASSEASRHRDQLIELICRYDQLAGHITRDQRDYSTAFAYANRAVKTAMSIGSNELIASALLRRAFISFDQKNYADAMRDLDAALPYAKHTSTPLKGFILQVAGHAHGHLTTSSTDITQAMRLLDQAGSIARQSNLEDDQSFVKFNPGWYHSERAETLIALNRPNDALDELDRAEDLLGPSQPRRLAYINIFRARAYTQKGEFTIATALAESAFTTSRAVKSKHNISHIEEIYQQLSNSKYGNSPQLARLQYLLTSR
jgi:tetratricopeptide (TPR) repeat protein